MTDLNTSVSFVVFAVAMFGVVLVLRNKKDATREGFYVANRSVRVVPGALSVAVSWVWAPALFVASSIAFDLGLPGALWFIVPNIACFFVFTPIAIRMRKTVPDGYTLPGYFKARFPGHPSVPIVFSVTAGLFMLTAIVENLVAMSKLYNFYTGNAGWIAIIVMCAITVGYSLISGLRASILTDVLQMAMVIVIGLILIPWVFRLSAGDQHFTMETFKGIDGNVSWIAVAFAPGLSLAFGLIGGPLGDQMFFQRAMAVKKENIRKTMYLAGGFFAIVPVTLCLFGFLGVALRGSIVVADSELVGAVIIQKYLPAGASVAFFALMMCGLASTLDSAFCGAGAIGGRSIASRATINEKSEINASRLFMIGAAILGAVLASVSRDIWYVFMTDASIASAGIVPIVLSVFWKRQTGSATFWSLVTGAAVGIVVSIGGHFFDLEVLAALGAPLAVAVGLIVSVAVSLGQPRVASVVVGDAG
jgi:urea-proton symporter